MRCREPLPPLFMRFVMQAGFAWPALTPLTVDLLCKLIGKQARLAATSHPVSCILRPTKCVNVNTDCDRMICRTVNAFWEPAGLRCCLVHTGKTRMQCHKRGSLHVL